MEAKTVEAGTPSRVLHIRLEPTFKKRLAEMAEQQRRSMAAQAQVLLEQAISERETGA